VRLIPAENKRTQLGLQTELAEKKHKHFTHRSYSGEHNKSKSRKKKVVTLNVIKSFACRPEIGSKYFEKLKLEPGPTRSGRKKTTRRITLHHVETMGVGRGGRGPWTPWI